MTVAALFLEEGDFHVAPFSLVDFFEVCVAVFDKRPQVGSQGDHAAFVDLQVEQLHEFTDFGVVAAVLAHFVWRIAEDEVIATVFGRRGGADLEDIGTDGLGLGQKLRLFDVTVEDLRDLSTTVDKRAELCPAAKRLQTHRPGPAEQIRHHHIFQHPLGIENAEQGLLDPIRDRTGVPALRRQEFHSFFCPGDDAHFLFSHELTLIFTNYF